MHDAEVARPELVDPLDDPVGLIFRELADPRIRQESVALTYALIIRQEQSADWPRRAVARRAPRRGPARSKAGRS